MGGEKTFQAMGDGRQMVVENVESKANSDLNRKKQGRGRGHSVSGRGRGSRANDQTKSQISSSTCSPSNGQLENSYHKVCSLVRTVFILIPYLFCNFCHPQLHLIVIDFIILILY